MNNNRAAIVWLMIVMGPIALLPATASAQSSARNFYISVDGTKQGVFQG
jgi:hypothetical protein